MDVVEKISSRIILLYDGKIATDGTFAQLQADNTEGTLERIFNQLTGFHEHQEIGEKLCPLFVGTIMTDFKTLRLLDKFRWLL